MAEKGYADAVDALLNIWSLAGEDRAWFKLEKMTEIARNYGKALDKTPQPEAKATYWIPVSERRPEEAVQVIVHFNTGGVDAMDALYLRNLWATREPGEDCFVTHWMPLPDVPLAQSRSEKC